MARIFGIDPIVVLDCNRDEYQIRLAAAEAARRQMSEEVDDGSR